MTLGYMPMPANFRYTAVLQRGMPQHDKWDSFRLKHPSMPAEKWAKIFSPFDALKGFNEAVAEKEVLYEFKRELSDEDRNELNRRLNILHNLTYNGRMARANRVQVTVEYYVPCADKDNFAYGYRGQYVKVAGMVQKVDPDVTHSIVVDGKRIAFKDISSIESKKTINGRNVFDLDEESWYDE